MTQVGKTTSGKTVYKYTFNKVTDIPNYLIISYDNGNSKIYDGVAFVNHGYYVEGLSEPTRVITTTGISQIRNNLNNDKAAIYDMQGRRIGTEMSQLPRGLYIRNGKKFAVR